MADGVPYIYIAYPDGGPLAYFLIELSADMVARECLASPSPGDAIDVCVYQGDDPVILPALSGAAGKYENIRLYPAEEEMEADYAAYRVGGGRGIYAAAEYSDRLGLLFVSFLRPAGMKVAVLQMLKTCLPPVLISFCALAAAYYLFVKKMYVPISSLVAETSENDGGLVRESRDEMDFLIRAYRKKDEHLKEMDYLLSANSRSMLDQLFASLIKAGGDGEARTASLLRRYFPETVCLDARQAADGVRDAALAAEARQKAGGPVSETSSKKAGGSVSDAPSKKAIVFALRLLYEEYELSDEAECAVQRAVLREKAVSYWEKCDGVCAVATAETGQYQVAAVICIEIPEEELAAKCGEFEREMLDAASGSRAAVGIGRAAASPDGIPAAYRAACEDVSRRRYFEGLERGSAATLYEDEFRRQLGLILIGEDGCEEELRRLPGRMVRDEAVDNALIARSLKAAGTEVLIGIGVSREELEDIIGHDDAERAGQRLTAESGQDPELILAECGAFIDRLTGCLRQAGNARQFRYVSDAKQFIQENYADSCLSLDMVSERLGISKYYLSSLFTQLTDTGFSDYVRMVRVGKAKEMLEHTDSTASQVGLQAGFASPQSFYTVFKKYVGDTPRNYRQKVRGQL